MSVTPAVLANDFNAFSQLFAPQLKRQWNRATHGLGSISFEAGFGKNVAWDAAFTGVSANAYLEGSDVQSSEWSVDTFQPATLSWAHYRSAFWVSDTDYDVAATSDRTATGLIAMLNERMMGAIAQVASVCNKDFYFGTGTATTGPFAGSAPNITGCLGGALSTSGIYANINRATYPEWQGNVLANGGVARPLTLDLISQLENNIFVASNERPDLILVDPGTFRKYQGLFEPIRRVEGEEVGKYDTSTIQLYWQGIPVVRDKDLVNNSTGNGTMIMLKQSNVASVYLPYNDMSVEDVFKSRVAEGAGMSGDMKTPIGTPFRIVPLARTGDASKFMIYVRLGVKFGRPNSCGYISDISIS